MGDDKAEVLRELRALLDGAGSGAGAPSSAGERTPGHGACGPRADGHEIEERAREYLLRSLTASARTRAQLAEGLARRDVPQEVADRLLDRFAEVGLIDDAEYARRVARTRFAERGLSRRGIGAELRRKGLSELDIAQAVGQLDDADEEDAARRIARTRLARTAQLERDVRIRRVTGVLARKGYSPTLASRIVREELASHDADGADEGWMDQR